ncbi:MAG TPA: hypothetical protein V6D48_07765, partial [Oculatellaceae cyanobacterium]
QQLTLEILADKKTMAVGKLFGTLVLEKEPLPYLGDTMYWHVLTEMLQSNRPPFEITTESIEQPWYKRVLQLTETGRALVRGEVNWLEIGSCDRWVGGIHIISGQPLWMWDEARNQPVLKSGV